MTKVTNPLLGFKAHGSIGSSLTYQDRDRGTMVRQKPSPTDPRTLAQTYHRWLYQDYAAYWHSLSAAEKQTWETNARRLRITGFNYWMRTCLTTLPDIAVGFRLDRKVGTSVIDFSKNENNGVVYGAKLVDGYVGKALSFDGIDDRVQIPHSPSLNLATAFTIEAVIKPASVTGYHCITEKWDNCLEFRTLHTGMAVSIGGVVFAATGGSWWFYADMGLTLQEWAHISFRLGGGIATLNRDGAATIKTTTYTGTPNINSYPLRVGLRRGGDNDYDGLIDSVIIYNRYLADSDTYRHAARRYPQ